MKKPEAPCRRRTSTHARSRDRLMEDPIVIATGQTYERDAISQWLRTKQTDPISNARLSNKKLVPNFALRGMIVQWKEAHLD